MRAATIVLAPLFVLATGCATVPFLVSEPFAPDEAPGHTRVVRVAPVAQEAERTCGAAALATVLTYWGVDASVERCWTRPAAHRPRG